MCCRLLTLISISGRATLQNWSLVLYGTKKLASELTDSISAKKAPKIKTNGSKKVKNPKKQKSKSTQKPASTLNFGILRAPKSKIKIDFVNSNIRNKKKPPKSKLDTTLSPLSYFYNFTKSHVNYDKNTDIVLENVENLSRVHVFQKYSNYQYVYPELTARNSNVGMQTQRQKEISRDLNTNRNVKFVKNTVELTTPVNVSPGNAKKFTAGNQYLIACM